jgi:hypothetical protein
MAAPTVLQGDVTTTGVLNCKQLISREATITNAMIDPTAGIAATKIQKPRRIHYGQSGTAAAATIPIYVCNGATAAVESIRVGSIAACIGGATVTVDLKKNGTTILSSVVTLNSSNTARIVVDGTVSSPNLVADDFLELVITAAVGGGTLATGLFVQVEVFEDQP